MRTSTVIIISLSIAIVGTLGHLFGVHRLPTWLTDNPIGFAENELEK